jgi:hypothetical protein
MVEEQRRRGSTAASMVQDAAETLHRDHHEPEQHQGSEHRADTRCPAALNGKEAEEDGNCHRHDLGLEPVSESRLASQYRLPGSNSKASLIGQGDATNVRFPSVAAVSDERDDRRQWGHFRRFGPGAPLSQLWDSVRPCVVLERRRLCRRHEARSIHRPASGNPCARFPQREQ